MEESVDSKPAYDYITFPRQFVSYKWYKPLLVLALGFVFMLVFQIILVVLAIIWNGSADFILNYDMSYDNMDVYTGPGALFELGGVAAMLPALALAALIVRDRPYSSYSSSRGGWNWGAFAKCLVVAVIVMGVSTIIDLLMPGHMEETFVNRFTVAGVILCIILLPFQCVAEEYVFRGLFMQTVGSWFKLPVVGIIVSAVVFAAGHMYNEIGLVLIFFNGIVWGIVAWQTKGLEATSAVHIVNNFLAFALSGSGIQPSTSEVDIASLFVALVIDIVYAAAVLLLGRKFNWFTSKGDGAAAFNEKTLAKKAAKEQARLAAQGMQSDVQYPPQQYWQQQSYLQQPTAQQPYQQQPAAQPYPQQTVEKQYTQPPDYQPSIGQWQYPSQVEQRTESLDDGRPEPPIPRSR